MKEALKLALEALEGVLDNSPKVLEASITGGLYEVIQCRDAITAIKEALAQPEQEPVGWLDSNDKLAEFMHKDLKAEHDKRDSSTPRYFQIPVYTTPPQRTWVGLTDEEIQTEWVLTPQNDKAEGIWFGRRIEAKLREKNNG